MHYFEIRLRSCDCLNSMSCTCMGSTHSTAQGFKSITPSLVFICRPSFSLGSFMYLENRHDQGRLKVTALTLHSIDCRASFGWPGMVATNNTTIRSRPVLSWIGTWEKVGARGKLFDGQEKDPYAEPDCWYVGAYTSTGGEPIFQLLLVESTSHVAPRTVQRRGTRLQISARVGIVTRCRDSHLRRMIGRGGRSGE